MRQIILIIPLLAFFNAMCQVKIHAHNDYEKPYPLVNALKYRVFSIEADVYPIGNELFVAHNKADIRPGNTLSRLYIDKIVALFNEHKGAVTSDTGYRLALVIDIKENHEEVIRQLVKVLERDIRLFDRSLNPNAVQIIISGDRGPVENWASYPRYLYFDGRPTESYNPVILKRVATISDSYSRYSGDETKIANVVTAVHQLGKPLRFWGAPDDEPSWRFLHAHGVDIINSDKVEACSRFFEAIAAGEKQPR